MKTFEVEYQDNSIGIEYYLIMVLVVFILSLFLEHFIKQRKFKKAQTIETDEERGARFYALLVDSIQMLCLPFEEQKALLPDFVDAPFEVIDDFEGVYSLFPFIVETEKLTIEQIEAVNAIHDSIEEIDWSILDCLEVSEITNYPPWAIVREHAKIALQKLGKPIEPPMGNNKTYIRG